MSTSNDIQRHLAIVATGEEPGGDLTFDGATGKLRVVRECPLDTAGTTRTTDQKQDLKTLLECSICLVTFDDPRTLPCLHSFCKKCLENFVDGKCEDELNCPLCRSKFALNKEEGVRGMTRNHFICNMIEVLSIQDQDKRILCSHCGQPSVGRCVSCELFMCDKCTQSHNEYIGFRDHVVLTMEELSKPENQSKIKKISKCTQHPNKKLKYYCETCNQLICRHCMEFDHDKQHKFSPLEQAAQSKRKDLKTSSEILEKTVADCNRETRVLKEDCVLLNRNFDKAQRVINERKEQLLGRLQERLQKKTNSMIDDARQVFDRKTRNIDGRINDTLTFVNRVKASADMAHSLLENGNEEEIVRSFQSVQENVNNTKREAHEDVHDDVGVLPWNSAEIDKMLLAEVEDIVEDKGEIKIIPGSNPHRLNGRAKKEIENGAEEAPDNGKRMPTGSEKKNGRKGRDNTAQGETKKKDRTLQDEATVFQDSRKKGVSSDRTSLRQVWDASLSGAVPHFGTTQGRDHDTQGQGNCSQPAYPSTLQQLFATQPLHSQARSHATQRNIPPTGGAYASPQSPQHSSYPQQTSQRSARDRGHSQGSMSHQSYAAQHSRQAQAKDRGGTVAVSLGKLTATGCF